MPKSRLIYNRDLSLSARGMAMASLAINNAIIGSLQKVYSLVKPHASAQPRRCFVVWVNEAVMVAPEQCTRSPVLTAVRRLRSPSSRQREGQYIVGTVTRSIEGTSP